MSTIRDDIQSLVNHLDEIRTILDRLSSNNDQNGTIDSLSKIVTIPDLLVDDRLTETIIYITDFYNLDDN